MKRLNAITVLLAATALACGSSGGGGGNNSKPTIVSFSAIPGTVQSGNSTALTWNVSGASTLSIDQGVGAVTGTATAVSPAATTTYTLTATSTAGSATATTTVTVTPAAPTARIGFKVQAPSGSVIAGTAVTLTITALDTTGGAAASYTGTVHLTTTDAQVPASDVTFAAADHGVKTASITPKTAGAVDVTALDAAAAQLVGTLRLTVGPAAASHCVASGSPAAARAGDPLSLRVTALDAFGNVATSYAGTVGITSSDSRALLPAAATFGAGDQGARVFSLRLGSLGAQSLTASDGTISCSPGTVTISAGPAAAFALTGLPLGAIAGNSLDFTVTATDAFGNRATAYNGPVTLSSTDAAATLTAPAGAFTAGQKTFSVVFATIGAQTVVVTDSGAGFDGIHAPVAVHGLVYTPSPGSGLQVSLNLNANASNAGLVVLDLVTNSAITGYSVGMNLPADGTRVRVVGISRGTGLDPGAAPPAMAVALPSAGPLANTLTSGLSQKAGGSGAVTTDASIVAGAVLYSLRLSPASLVPGVIFDGSSSFRAAVRNLAGDELLSQRDFAVGKLELQ